jgi:hypothetical protein
MAKSKKTSTNLKGWQMPEQNLFNRLKEKTRGRIIIADECDHSELTDRCNKDDAFINRVKFSGESFAPSTKPSTKNPPAREPLYVEYEVKN